MSVYHRVIYKRLWDRLKINPDAKIVLQAFGRRLRQGSEYVYDRVFVFNYLFLRALLEMRRRRSRRG